jgi:WD40 repeat protein
LASAALDSTVRVWDARSGTPLHSFTDVLMPVGELAFSEDGRQLAAKSERTLKPELVHVWDVATDTLVDFQEGLTDVTTYLWERGNRCFIRSEGGQRVLFVIDPSGSTVAAVPSDFDLGQTHPSGLAWAWRTGRHLDWVRLEDA